MRKAITALALLLFPWSLLGQNGPLQGTSTVGGISATTQGAQSANKLQGVIPSALITVYLTGTQSPATLYTALGSPAANPFYSNAATANNPGGWITYAPINVGYDIVASSGQGVSNCSTGPLCYAQPVTLCVDCFAGGSGGGGGGAVNSVSNSDSSLTVAPNTGSVVVSLNPANANNWTAIQTFPVGSITNPELQYPSTTVNGQSCVLGSACTIAIGGVNSVFNTDGTLVISPTTGNVAASLNLGKANNWTAIQTFIAGSITNVELANSSVTVNGQSCVLGGTCTIATGSTTNALTINNSGSGASSGSTFNGSSALTISYNTLGAPGTAATNTFTGANTFSNASFLLSGLASLPVSGTYCLQIGTTGQLSTSGSTCGGGGGGAVNSVANSDGTLTISPTSGSVVASMALGHANTWTATQTFPSASITNAELANTSITINSTTCTLGSTCTVSGGGSGTITGVTAGTNLSGGGSSGTVTLNVIASPVFTTTRNTGNVTPSSSGIWTMYNAASANETDFANNPSSGSGGFNFYNTSSGGTLGTAILAIDGSGNGTFQGTGTFLGSGSPGITMAPTTTPATGSNNYGSVPLTFQSNFYSAGSFTAQWNVAANIGTGSTPSPALVFSGPAALPVNDDVVYELDPSIAATSSVNYNSPNILLKAPYWNGTASAVDTWYILDTLGTGANPFSALTLSHGGTTGNATVSLPGIQIVNPTLAYPIALTNNTASTSGSNVQAPSMTWNGTYWTGSVSATDSWYLTPSQGTGANPYSILSYTHSGTSGTAAVQVPLLKILGISSGCLQLNGSNQVTSTGANCSLAAPSQFFATISVGSPTNRGYCYLGVSGCTNIFQNTSGSLLMVSVTGYIGTVSCTVYALTGASNPPGAEVYAQVPNGSGSTALFNPVFFVMPNQYYDVNFSSTGCGQTTTTWQEITL